MTSHAHALAGIPAIDSPFFADLFAAADPPTRRIAEALQRQGFAVIDFPDQAFDERAAAIKAALVGRFDWAGWRDSGFARGQGLRLQDAWAFDPNVRSLATNPDLLALLSRLYGRPAKPFQTLNFPVGTQQDLHSDAIHFSSMPQGFMCGVWVALEDIAAEAGPLEYCPGSHAWPVCTNDMLDASVGPTSLDAVPTAWQALLRLHGATRRQFLARKGQALIWAANLLHGGARQTDPERTRWSQVTHYYFAGCAYYTPLFSDPFAGRVAFRHPIDIATGRAIDNVIDGEAIDAAFIAAASERADCRRAQRGSPPPGFDDDTDGRPPLALALAEQDALRARLAALEGSQSWRLTAPLRRLRGALGTRRRG